MTTGPSGRNFGPETIYCVKVRGTLLAGSIGASQSQLSVRRVSALLFVMAYLLMNVLRFQLQRLILDELHVLAQTLLQTQ